MPAPAGYQQMNDGGWVAPDGSGPVALEFGGPAQYEQLHNGFWMKTDGSGPYSYDGAGGYTLATSIYRS